MFEEIDVYFFNFEMREIVFLNTVNSRYLKVEVHPKLFILQRNFSGPR